jgi:hypothetical protein
VRPDSFDADLADEWSRWVLAHGLPDLPGPDLAPGESVPVAYWIGPRTAAVMHVRWDDGEEDQPPFTESDVVLFHLVDGAWEDLSSGGGNWADERRR